MNCASSEQDAHLLKLQPVLVQVRQRLAGSGGDACRLFHGPGSGIAGWEAVTIDYFQPLILVRLCADLEEATLLSLLEGLESLGTAHTATTVAVQGWDSDESRLHVHCGTLPQDPVATERGLSYAIALDSAQGPGFLLDRAEARRWLASVATGKRVLNLFADTCAFSVAARAGGASHVVNLDTSAAALRLGQQNHRRNGTDTAVSYLSHNLFKSWPRLRRAGPFDIIVVDPPMGQSGDFMVERDYARVIAKLEALCAPGAEVLLCLGAPHLPPGFLLDLVARYAPALAFEERLPVPPAFAISDAAPALKVMRFRYSESI